MIEQGNTSSFNESMVRHLMREGEKARGTAVALYGTSTYVLHDILTTGSISSYPKGDMIAYQRDLVKDGGHLYYAIPSFDRLEKIKPQVAEEMRKRYQHLDPRLELTREKVRQTAQMYALEKSLGDFFSHQLGQRVNSSTGLYLMYRLLPQVFEAFSQKTFRINTFAFESLDVIRENAQNNVLQSVLQKFPRKILEGVIQESTRTRGVLLYFSQELFSGNRVLAGKETEGEIMIVSPKPLSASVISGVEFLSDYDIQSFFPKK